MLKKFFSKPSNKTNVSSVFFERVGSLWFILVICTCCSAVSLLLY